MKRDLQEYAENRFSEEIANTVEGFVDVADAVSTVEDLEGDFDAESYCPYYHEQVEVIDNYESDFGNEAEDICDSGTTYKASEYQQALTAYAYAIAYCGFQSYFQAAKSELIEALEEFEADAQLHLNTGEEIRVQLTTDCPHGWAAHDRELEDGTMIWESGQLDGCNGMAREVSGVWISCRISPATEAV
jgi:hypothetical protein